MRFADDIIVGVSSQEEYIQLYKRLLLYQKAFNVKLNLNKSQSLPLNDIIGERIESIKQLLSKDKVFQYLGYLFYLKYYPLPITYFNSFLDILQKTITTW